MTEESSEEPSPKSRPAEPVEKVRKKKTSRTGNLGCFPWVAVAVTAALIGYMFYKRLQREEPPDLPAKKTFTAAAYDFYRAYQESVAFMAKGKTLFFQGRELMESAPESLPESVPIEAQEGSPFFKAAENFALAMEQFDHAKDLLKTDSVGLKPQERDCQGLLRDNLEKYEAAVKIFNEYAKAQYQGSEAKAEKFAVSDGNAKWDMAESLMSSLLAEGCQGQFFLHVQEQDPNFRRKVYDSYRAYYGDKFEAQRLMFSTLMAYPGPEETSPHATPESVPTKVYRRNPE